MSDDLAERRAIRDGARARAELEQTEAAFARVREAMLTELVQTPPEQVNKIAKLHLGLQILPAVRDALVLVINDGVAAEHAIATTGLTRR